ncbi:MAG: DNA-directed RNA polymerase subunit omega [Thermoanaerobaculia bacterium]
MERIPGKIDSRFRFVLLAAQRAEQMMRGGRPKVEMGELKPTRVALEEISNDLVDWDYGPLEEPAEETEAEVEAETKTD